MSRQNEKLLRNRWNSFLRRAAVLALTAVLLAGSCLPAMLLPMHANAAPYAYTVTVDEGLHGTAERSKAADQTVGGEGLTFTVPYGETFDPEEYVTVTVTDPKYYFKGFHVAGQEGVRRGGIEITKDLHLVAAYGIAGGSVKYTVRYEDTDGKELAPAREYYGDVGEKPVVACLYFEGYLPQAYGLTKTLTSNEAENVLTFVYRPVETAAPVQPATQAPAQPSGGESAAPAQPGGPDETQPGEETEPSGQGGTEPSGQGETQPGEEETIPRMINLDDETLPLASGESGEGTRGSWLSDFFRGPGKWYAGGAVAGVGLLAVLIAALKRRKKENQE